MDELWDKFLISGSVEDYLNYKIEQKSDNSYADNGKRLDNKRTDNGGE